MPSHHLVQNHTLSSIKKRPGSKYYWYTTGTPPNRIRVSTAQTNQHAAKIIQKEFDERYERHRLKASPNLSKFIDSYLIWHQDNKKPDWNDRVKIGLERFREMYANIDITYLDIEHIQAYKTFRMQSVAGNTINHEMSMISGLFKYAQMRRMIIGNPADPFFVSRVDTEEDTRNPIPIHIIKEIIQNTTNEKDKAMFCLALYAGFRAKDAGTITEDEIKDEYLIWKQGKVGRKCVVPKHPIFKGMTLVNLKPEKSQRRSVTERLKKTLAKDYGIAKDDKCSSFHSIRHTYGDRLEDLGLDFLEVKFLMGHSIKDVTWRYIHKNVDKFKPAIYSI